LPVFRYLGRISYGLYLIHLLVFDAYDSIAHRFFPRIELFLGTFSAICIRFLCATCAAVAIAHISREYFESLFLNLKDRFGSSAESTPSPMMLVSSKVDSVGDRDTAQSCRTNGG